MVQQREIENHKHPSTDADIGTEYRQALMHGIASRSLTGLLLLLTIWLLSILLLLGIVALRRRAISRIVALLRRVLPGLSRLLPIYAGAESRSERRSSDTYSKPEGLCAFSPVEAPQPMSLLAIGDSVFYNLPCLQPNMQHYILRFQHYKVTGNSHRPTGHDSRVFLPSSIA